MNTPQIYDGTQMSTDTSHMSHDANKKWHDDQPTRCRKHSPSLPTLPLHSRNLSRRVLKE